MKLSVSLVKLYEDCPFAYYLQEIKKVPQIKTKALIEGGEIHDIFNKCYDIAKTSILNKNLNPNEKLIIEEFKEQIKTIKPEYQIHFENFINFNEIIQSIPIYKEVKLYDKELDFVGIIDRVDEQKDILIVLDYKTGREEIIEAHKYQLAMYHYLFKQIYNQSPTHWGIYYSKVNKILLEPSNETEVLNAINRTKLTRIKIEESMKNGFEKIKSWKCKWCQFKGECEK